MARERAVFRSLYEHFADEDIISFEADVQAFQSLISGAFQSKNTKVLVSELEFADAPEEVQAVLDILKNTSVSDAMRDFEALRNAMTQGRYRKIKDWKLSDMEIVLL